MQEKNLEPTESNWAKVRELEKDTTWLTENNGKWVAIVEGEVVEIGADPKEVRETVARKYLEGLILLVKVVEGKLVPEENIVDGKEWSEGFI